MRISTTLWRTIRTRKRQRYPHEGARRKRYSRPTIEKAISNQLHNPYRLKHPKASPIFGPYQGRVDALLLENDHLPRKQRYTVHRMFEILQIEGYHGSESRIRQYVSARHAQTRTPEVFLPLEFEPGQDAQIDWVRRVGAYEIPV